MECDLCKQTKPDAMRRMSPRSASSVAPWPGMGVAVDPVLCVVCASDGPGRSWMKASPWRPPDPVTR